MEHTLVGTHKFEDPTSALPDDFFELGNYVHCAQHYPSSDWRKYAALGLIGKTAQAVTGLALSNSSEARFYLGATFWIAGEQELAEKALCEAATPRAARLLKLIRKDQISVLGQFPFEHAAGNVRDSKFDVRLIGAKEGYLVNVPYGTLTERDLKGFRPDFFACNMIEWHDIPRGIWDLGIPMFGTTSDYDAHIQNVASLFYAFDSIVVSCGSAWKDLNAWGAAPVCTFPKIFGLSTEALIPNWGRRDTDIFMSGFLWHPYNLDKVELIHKVLEIKNAHFLCWQGVGTSLLKYFAQLNDSKATWSFVRRADEVPTRALDSLAHGCAVAIQRDSVLNLYMGESEGLAQYSNGEELKEALSRMVTDWKSYVPRVRRGSELVQREWLKTTTVSQLLRFLTVMASNPAFPRQKKIPSYWPQKEFLFLRGFRLPPEYLNLRSALLLNRFAQNVDSTQVPHEMLDTARECALLAARRSYAPAVRCWDGAHDYPRKDRLGICLELYKACAKRFFNALVPRFNMIRMALHLGNAQQVTDALTMLKDVISAPATSWQVDALEDVFPFDFFPMFFNYREYFDSATRQFVTKETMRADFIRLIRASLYAYLGHYTNPIENFSAAAELDPSFDYYRLRYAQALVSSNQPELVATATNLLLQLCERSLYFGEAYYILQSLARQGRIEESTLRPHSEKASRLRGCIIDLESEDWDSTSLQRAAYIP